MTTEQTHADAAPPEGVEPPRTLAEDPPGEQTTEPAADAPAVDEQTLAAIRAAEAAQQASVCHLPAGKLPADLAKALHRRVEVNLAQYDGQSITRVGGSDPEVRRLEAPWSRRVAPAPTDGDSHRRRSTKKKSTKRGQS